MHLMYEHKYTSVRARLVETVYKSLLARQVAAPVGAEDDLREVLTSMEMVNLMLTIELEFGLKIPARDMTTARFRSIASIETLVETLAGTPQTFS